MASMRLNQVTVGATDLPASIAFYRALGFTLIVRSDHYARFIVPDGVGTFSLHLTPAVPRDGAPVVYFECDDLDARHARLRDAGITFDLPPTDQPWLWREAHLRDPAGNALILFYAGVNRLDPPWRIPPGDA
jgi:catechol 2,3-dioxygenase-like lactoylglutathione lyase family enzyme